MQRAEAVAALPTESRSELTVEHAHVLAKEAPEADRQKWAQATKEENLSPRELQHSIRRGEVTRQAQIDKASGANSGICVVSSVEVAFRRWLQSVGGPDGVRGMSDSDQDSVIEALWPIVSFVHDLEEE